MKNFQSEFKRHIRITKALLATVAITVGALAYFLYEQGAHFVAGFMTYAVVQIVVFIVSRKNGSI